jgi:hypothetical protein
VSDPEVPVRTLAPLLALATACTGDLAIDADHPLSASVDPDGGSLDGDGVRLDVPAGAVDQDVTLTAFPSTIAVSGLTSVSPVWTFGPDGTQFGKPVTVHLALTADGTAEAIWWTKPGDLTSFELLQTSIEDGWAVATITHFSEGVVADGDCGCGDDDGDGADGDHVSPGDDDASGDDPSDDATDPNDADDTAEEAGDDADATCVCDDDDGDDDGSDDGEPSIGDDDDDSEAGDTDADDGDDPADG